MEIKILSPGCQKWLDAANVVRMVAEQLLLFAMIQLELRLAVFLLPEK